MLLTETIGNIKAEVETKLAQRPEKIVVVSKESGERKELPGVQHAVFENIVKRAQTRQNILLIGPAGCGKSAVAHQVADALKLQYGFVSLTSGVSEAHLTGWLLPVEAGGKFTFIPSKFVEMYENGGLFLIDEIDAGDPNMLLVINAALANGHMMIPQRHENPRVKRHPDFICMAAANTFGNGPDRMYAGRNQLDAASTDRFRANMIVMDYDPKLEARLIDPEVLAWGVAIRTKINSLRLRRVLSTRVLIDYTVQKQPWGATQKDWEETYFADWSRDELTKIDR